MYTMVRIYAKEIVEKERSDMQSIVAQNSDNESKIWIEERWNFSQKRDRRLRKIL